MLFTTHKKEAVFPGKAAYEARVLESVMEGETALVRVPDSDSTQASLFTEHFSGVICFTGD